jgi:peptidyl-prolyl cis-trans isomerase SurA
MPDFGVGQFEPTFESKVWALTKDGAITKPFLTSHGYHIVQRNSLVPVISDPNNKAFEQDLRQRVLLDQRWKESRDVIYDKVIRLAGLTESKYDNAVLQALTDSLLDRTPLGIGSAMTPESPLFKLGDTLIKVSDWAAYAQAFRYRTDGSGRKPYNEVMDEFKSSIAFQYYRNHLENFNDEFRNQMSEFRDGNLFFEIMQQEIWNRAHTDSAELLALYETNKKKYTWAQSADAVIFFCSDAGIAKTLYDQVKKNPSNWRTLADALTEKVVADSSRYEWSQIPSKTKIIPVAGMVTTPMVNATDNTASFAYIIKTYPQSMQRSYNEAKGLVINDYQAILEEQWIKQLRAKYPVVIDQAVWNKIVN